MKFLQLILFVVLSVLVGQTLTAQTMIRGTVIDQETREPMIGAAVKLTNGTYLMKGAVTDFDGRFSFDVAPGTYSLEVRYTGMNSKLVAGLTVVANQILETEILLEGSHTLSEVVIAVHKTPIVRKDVTSGSQTVTSDQIRNLPTRSADKEKRSRSKRSKDVSSSELSKSATSPYPATQPAPKSVIGNIPSPTEPVAGGEGYSAFSENPFLNTVSEQISTFSIDVDGASYANVRRFIHMSSLPPRDAVRIEEMVNYFDYTYPQPEGDDPFEIVTQLDQCPWAPDHQLLLVALQGRKEDLEQLPASNLVFLVDVSGSMGDENKLPLVKKSLNLLLDQLRPEDHISLVTYAGNTSVILSSTPASQKQTIQLAIEQLGAGGSTAGASGIQLAYTEARKHQRSGNNSRVILCTDGDFNVGISSEQELVKLIENERESGVFLTVLGFGMGNYQDSKMQQLANKGNGNHAYIDSAKEAKKVFVNELGGTLYTIAKDVKLQLIFNPEHVASYRLIGYENRMLATEDFDNDKKDAGELGSGHVVTALYELVPPAASIQIGHPFPRKQETIEPVVFKANELMSLRLRYKAPKGKSASKLIEKKLSNADMGKTSDAFLTASTVAAFGMMLRKSEHRGITNWTKLEAWSKTVATLSDPHGYRNEFYQLVQRAASLDLGTHVRK